MKKWISLIVILSLMICTLTGCWNRRELNQISIAVGMAIDKSGDGYRVSVQVVNPSKISQQGGGGLQQTPVTVFSQRGSTIFEAIRRIITVSSRKTYFAHLRILILSEELAKQGVSKTFDLIWRDQEFRSDFYLMIAKNSRADTVLKQLTPLEKLPANDLFYSLEESEKAWAPTTAIDINEFISDSFREGKNPIVGGVKVKGNINQGETLGNLLKSDGYAHLISKQIAIFKRDKLVGWLNEKESKGYNYAIGNVHSTVGCLKCPDGGKITQEVIRSQSKMHGSVRNGKPEIKMNINLEQNVADVECNWDITKQSTINKINEQSEKKVISVIKLAIRKAQDKDSDIFGFGDAIHKSNPQEWKRLKPHWDQEFKKIKVDINVQAKTREFGTTNQSILKDTKE
ncbi:Ger(x)C family spore germination protein [Fictibacillus sp. WQ 8-8]|uniref:Ger(x)C family spore germination protein n=1 Tax=Fictibacillus sp. WQ 8-8 TaxID=2938788 RepID=UPI002108BA9A|nr:Ger(x)C family spore germination protein [Fictibacillus sp. WQ 8-8]MCQ6268680.1 Ger(x)C family spore germination protein [Fictibacillus sp. WQ 8-8]